MNLGKRSAALIATGLAGAMALTACGGGGSNNNSASGGSSSSGGQASGRVVYGEATDWPENLFPLISAGNVLSVGDITVGVLPEAYLIQPDTTLKPNPDLLSSEPTSQVSGNTQTITYHINPQAVWSDGVPIDVKDFQYTYGIQKSNDPAKGGCAAILSTTGYDHVQSVQGADNGKTVTVQISPPYADWKALFSGNTTPIFPAHVMDKGNAKANCDAASAGWPTADGLPNDISGGPWQIKKSNINNGQKIIVLTPNPKYWGANKAHLAQLVVQGIGNDPTTAVQGIRSGELGVIYPQPQLDLVNQIKSLAPKVNSKINFGLSFEHLDFNASTPLFSDINVRKAVAMSLDRQQIVDQTVGQFSSDAKVLNNRIWLTTQPQYEDNAPPEYKSPHPDQAKQLLQSSGWTLGPDGIFVKNGQRLSFKIDTTVNNPLRQQTIQVMIPQLKAAGIEAQFNGNPDIFKGPDKPTSLVSGGFQAALFAWVGNPFISSQPPIYESPQGAGATQQNYARVGTPEIDNMLRQWLTMTSDQQVKDEGNKIDQALWALMPTLPLYQKPTFVAWQSNIQNVQDNPTQQGILWNAASWTVK